MLAWSIASENLYQNYIFYIILVNVINRILRLELYALLINFITDKQMKEKELEYCLCFLYVSDIDLNISCKFQ